MLRYGFLGLALLQATLANPDIKPQLQATGKGVQIYVCNAEKGWVFRAPEATLYIGDEVVGRHGAGPRWTWKDGSSIVGKALTTTPAPDAERDIPWLALNVTAVSGPSGALSAITMVRRTDTHGGIAPTDTCDDVHEGALMQVPYTATYSFYR